LSDAERGVRASMFCLFRFHVGNDFLTSRFHRFFKKDSYNECDGARARGREGTG
jgi:hypothetical protein